MGADQSKQSEAAVNDELLERLHALNMNHDKYAQYLKEKEEYVVVQGDGEARMFLIPYLSPDTFLLSMLTMCSSSPVHTRRQVPAKCLHQVRSRVGEGAHG